MCESVNDSCRHPAILRKSLNGITVLSGFPLSRVGNPDGPTRADRCFEEIEAVSGHFALMLALPAFGWPCEGHSRSFTVSVTVLWGLKSLK